MDANRSLLAAKEHLRQAWQAGIASVNPTGALQRWVRQQDGFLAIGENQQGSSLQLLPLEDLRVLAIGKAAAPMALTSQNLLGKHIKQALAIGPAPIPNLPDPWLQVVGGHPLPDMGSLQAGVTLRQFLANSSQQTVILACISGGATAVVADPLPGISLDTLRAIYQALLNSGAPIEEMNVVRSSLDRLKGGGLVDLAQPAQVVGLILSDVVGDRISTIGSGLTDRPVAHNFLIGNNALACQGAATYLSSQGYQTQIVTTTMTGQARVVGRAIAQEILASLPGTALIYGGETTVTLPANCIGRGGRNQEIALAAAIELTHSPALVGSIGTDGIDGSSPAAGAIGDGETVLRAQQFGLAASDYLERHDSYHFFLGLGEAIVTGPTGTNVADVAIALHPP
jgi:glycerate 2-kinase